MSARDVSDWSNTYDVDCAFAIIRASNPLAYEKLAEALERARTENFRVLSRFAYLSRAGKLLDISHSSDDPQDPSPGELVIKLCLHPSHWPALPRVGWRVGLGFGDIWLSGGQYAPDQSFNITIHPGSGILMLKAHLGAHLEYINEDQSCIPILHDVPTPLLASTTMFWFGECQYSISYQVLADRVTKEIPEGFQRAFVGYLKIVSGNVDAATLERNDAKQFRHLAIYENLIKRQYLEARSYRRTGVVLGKGGFAHVFYGLNTQTAEPVAIKVIRVTKQAERLAVQQEIQVHRMLENKPGCLELKDFWCEHDIFDDCPQKDTELIHLVTILGSRDFRAVKFPDQFLEFEIYLRLWMDVFRGLQAMHDQEIIHRDINIKNLLVMSFHPPRAVVADFGMAIIDAPQRSYKYPGPKHNLAPELENEGPDYDETVDVWASAYAIAETLGYECPDQEIKECITHYRHAQLIKYIEDLHYTELTGLKKLLPEMLKWRRQERFDIRRTLQHMTSIYSSAVAAIPNEQRDDRGTKRKRDHEDG